MAVPIPVLPVANGVLPRAAGGKLRGVFVVEEGGGLFSQLGEGYDLLICPWITDQNSLYPVGVVARILEITRQTISDETAGDIPVWSVLLEGRGQGRWHSLRQAGNLILSTDMELLDFRKMRKEYPVISGAGWQPAGGFTEFRAKGDIPVTIYGSDLETGKEVTVSANLGGLVEQEQAHTIEHAIIRALRTYGLCSTKTLISSMTKETDELKQSLEFSIRFAMPEFLGMTATGACGNPMTNLAQAYLAKDFVSNVSAGNSLNEALAKARNSTMSQLTSDLGLTMQQGIRTAQGLKKGMSHDDSPIKLETCKKVINRFPLDPWG